MAGCKLRITKGRAIIVCAAGTSQREASHCIGGRLNATMNPSPSITADAPSGSISSGSRSESSLRGHASDAATGAPNASERITVIPAYARESSAARSGGT